MDAEFAKKRIEGALRDLRYLGKKPGYAVDWEKKHSYYLDLIEECVAELERDLLDEVRFARMGEDL